MATRNIVPREDEEGGIGTTLKKWMNGFFKFLKVSHYLDIGSTTPSTIANTPHSEGRIFYDDSHKMPAVYSTLTSDAIRLGQSHVLRVKNTSGSTINKLKAVTINGADGIHAPTISLAQADTVNNARVFGLAMEDISDQGMGLVMNKGMIHGVDTSAWASGTELFLSDSVAGGLTDTAPAIVIFIGWVINSDATAGSIELLTSDFFSSQGDMLKSVYDVDEDGVVDQAFAQSIEYAEDDTESSTTSLTYQDKVTLTFTPPSTGDYLIEWYYELIAVTNDKEIEARIYQDGTTVLSERKVFTKIIHPDYVSASGLKKVTIDNTSHNFKIQFRASDPTTAYMRRTRILARRVS